METFKQIFEGASQKVNKETKKAFDALIKLNNPDVQNIGWDKVSDRLTDDDGYYDFSQAKKDGLKREPKRNELLAVSVRNPYKGKKQTVEVYTTYWQADKSTMKDYWKKKYRTPSKNIKI